MQVTLKSVTKNELNEIIDFDNCYLMNAFIKLGIPAEQLPPSLKLNNLDQAILRGDVLDWIFVDNTLAGYYWFEIKPAHLYIAGLAIKPSFQGKGLIQQILVLADKKAKENKLQSCKLLTIPLNGRAVNAYLKYGYKIIQCALASYFEPEYPDSYRFMMEKNVIIEESVAIDHREVLCTNYELMKNLTDRRYIGVKLIRSSNQDNEENKILFEKF